MKASNSRRLLLALVVPGAAVAFVTPPVHQAIGARRPWGLESSSSASSTDVPSQSNGKGGAAFVADETRSWRNEMRDAIWKATDAMTEAIEDMPAMGSSTNDTWTRLGSVFDIIDDKMAKYQGVGVAGGYLSSIGTPKKEAAAVAVGSGGSPDDDEDKDKKTAGKAAEKVTSAVSSSVAEGEKNVSSDSSKTEDDVPAAVDAKTAVAAAAKTEERGNDDAAAASAAAADAGTGTVDLDRPKQVQGVFDELQKKAVEYYKSSPMAKATSSVPGTKFASAVSASATTPLSEALQTLETQLESLLEDSKFKPRKLKKEKKTQLVDTLKAMEDAYAADATPLTDPALSGQWSLVYSSSSRLFGRSLRGVLAKLFKTSEPRQLVDSKTSSVINACRARLRLTPLRLRVAQKGSYTVQKGEKRQVSVEFPLQKGGLWGLLPRLRSGKVQSEVTYLSQRWRICRAGDVTLAFRKNGD